MKGSYFPFVDAAEQITEEESNDEDEQIKEEEDDKKKKKKEKIGFRDRKVNNKTA